MQTFLVNEGVATLDIIINWKFYTMLKLSLAFTALSAMFAVGFVNPAFAAPKSLTKINLASGINSSIIHNDVDPDGPWCGTGTGHGPHIPRPKAGVELQKSLNSVLLNPQPLPPGLAKVSAETLR